MGVSRRRGESVVPVRGERLPEHRTRDQRQPGTAPLSAEKVVDDGCYGDAADVIGVVLRIKRDPHRDGDDDHASPAAPQDSHRGRLDSHEERNTAIPSGHDLAAETQGVQTRSRR